MGAPDALMDRRAARQSPPHRHLTCLDSLIQMSNLSFRGISYGGIALLICALAANVYAGGSGLNTAVIINQASSNSCELGNYFCERRQVPPENVLYITWPGSNISWSSNDFQTVLLNPLLAMLPDRQLTNQIDYVVLSMDIPFQTLNGSCVNSTTSALFYGLKNDAGPDWAGVANSYAGSEQVFRQAIPASAPGFSFLATMLTADSLALAERLVDQGVAADGTLPVQPVILAKSSDPLRNIRFHAFDNAIFNTRLCGDCSVQRTNLDSPWGLTNLLGFETGLAGFTVSPHAFVPGAMADSLTSFGGIIFGPNGQTSLLAFIDAGATGSYGTVTEPSADSQKFPDPQAYFYQARGFTLAESYYQSLYAPYEGLIVAEPLAAPFQQTGSGAWLGISNNAVLSGTALLSLQFTAADTRHPLQQIDLFLDGKYFQTLTNLPPQPGNQLNLTVKGSPVTYTVGPGSTVVSIANGLAAQATASANSAGSNLIAFAHGDRIELHSLSNTRPAPPTGLRSMSAQGILNANAPALVSNVLGTASSLSTFLVAGRNTFLNSQAAGIKACSLGGTVGIGAWCGINVIRTDGTLITLSVTNQSSSAALLDLAGQLVNLINSAPGLQGNDGITAEDLASGFFGVAQFNLRARGPGGAAAAVRIALSGSSSLVWTPAAQTSLNDNLSDLQPRNHIRVVAGATNLALTFPLDTTTLPDGFHELAAVAYEGSSVRAQTRTTVAVRIQNSSLAATLTLPDLADLSPVQGIYHIQVAANTNAVGAIQLFGTGGMLGAATNQPVAVFTVNGNALGAGLHPFYAVVQTTGGLKYRTETHWIRLVNGL
jgi:uncharacterized protein (TIGR03790 family)